MTKIRVFLADDHPDILTKVAEILGPEYEVVGTASDGQSLIDGVTKLNPDLLIVDITMPVLNGIKAAEKLRENGCKSKIIFLTMHADHDYLRACLATGAHGYILKSRMFGELLRAVEEAIAGRIFISPTLSEMR